MESAIALNLDTELGERHENAATLHSLFMGAIAPGCLTASESELIVTVELSGGKYPFQLHPQLSSVRCNAIVRLLIQQN
jgi:hypothetical protein